MVDPERTAWRVAAILAGVALASGGTASTASGADPGPPSAPTVIGYADTGINPYHQEFRAPGWTAHPSTYIQGYPASAEPIELTLDANTFEEAWQADRDEWSSLEPDQLYYVPGTRIVGVVDGDVEFRESPAPNYDFDGHGTLVASAGSGATLGTAPASAIAMASGGPGVAWLEDQPWIDLLSYSRGDLAGVGLPQLAATTHELADGGRSLFAAGGNGPVVSGPTTITEDRAGPPWTVTVGLYQAQDHPLPTGRFCQACHVPAEVLGTSTVPVAATDSLDDTRLGTGTSTATPRVAGHAARLVDLARERLDDVARPGFAGVDVYARSDADGDVPDRGPLADGALDRVELESLVRQAAAPAPWEAPERLVLGLAELLPDEVAQPAEARYTWQGYGVHDATALEHAKGILLGEQPWPDRPTDDRWHRFWSSVREAYWASLLCPSEDFRERYEGSCWTDPTAELARASGDLAAGAAR